MLLIYLIVLIHYKSQIPKNFIWIIIEWNIHSMVIDTQVRDEGAMEQSMSALIQMINTNLWKDNVNNCHLFEPDLIEINRSTVLSKIPPLFLHKQEVEEKAAIPIEKSMDEVVKSIEENVSFLEPLSSIPTIAIDKKGVVWASLPSCIYGISW